MKRPFPTLYERTGDPQNWDDRYDALSADERAALQEAHDDHLLSDVEDPNFLVNLNIFPKWESGNS